MKQAPSLDLSEWLIFVGGVLLHFDMIWYIILLRVYIVFLGIFTFQSKLLKHVQLTGSSGERM